MELLDYDSDVDAGPPIARQFLNMIITLCMTDLQLHVKVKSKGDEVFLLLLEALQGSETRPSL
jgi:hypothetical protein